MEITIKISCKEKEDLFLQLSKIKQELQGHLKRFYRDDEIVLDAAIVIDNNTPYGVHSITIENSK